MRKREPGANLRAKTLEDLFDDDPTSWIKHDLASWKGMPRGDFGRTLLETRLDPKRLAGRRVGGAFQVCGKGMDSRFRRLVAKLAKRIAKMRDLPTPDKYDEWNFVVRFNNDDATTFEDIKKVVKGL